MKKNSLNEISSSTKTLCWLPYLLMSVPRRITLDEVLADNEVDSLPEGENYYRYLPNDEEAPYSSGYSNSVSLPSSEHFDSFRLTDSYLNHTGSFVSHGEETSRYDFNWCNPDDYLLNWNSLTDVEKETLKSLLYSNTKRNPNRFGLKKLNLESHLLFSIGCDMSHLLGKSKNYVLSNLSDFTTRNLYLCVNDKNLDPKSALKAYRRFNKTYDLKEPFNRNMRAYHALITLKKDYSHVSSPQESKKIFQHFFRENTKILSRLSSKRKKFNSYLYSHEISVDSILSQSYKPHTHVILFMEKNKKDEFHQFQDLEKLETQFNLRYPSKTLSILKHKQNNISVPKKATSYQDIERSIQYMFRAYSLSETYMREVSTSNLKELNIKTKETIHNLIYLAKAEEANSSKGIRRIGCSQIPKKLSQLSELQR
jgi:hypothetical protein